LLFSLKQSDKDFAALLETCVTNLIAKWDTSRGVGKEMGLWRLGVFGVLPPAFRSKLVGLRASDVAALENNIRSLEAELHERRIELWSAVKNRVGKDVDAV
jgi:hypothetical protein